MTAQNRFTNKLKSKTEPKTEPARDAAPFALEPPKASEPRPVGRPKTGKSSNPDYVQATLYLPRVLYDELKIEAIKQGKEVSDLAESAIRVFLSKV
jgi:hypothetical protein